MASGELCWMSARKMMNHYTRGDLSPVEVAKAQLERIEEVDAGIGAFCLVDAQETLAQARQSEQRYRYLERGGLLDGVPVAVKDSFYTRGWSTRFGSRTTVPDDTLGYESPTVSALRRHNAVRLGKTTMPEFGWKAVTDSPLTGVTVNPWDPTKTCGGSSGGNGAALAAGMCSLAVGSDIGGSVRIPASFCGVVGLKPTQDLAPVRRDIKSGLLLHAGPMARTVEDLALAMDVLAEWDPMRPTRPTHGRSYSDVLGEDVEGLRVALSPGLGWARVHPEVERAVIEVGRTLELLDAWVSEVSPDVEEPTELYKTLFLPTLTMELENVDPALRDLLDPDFREAAEQGRSVAAWQYVDALQRRRALISAMARLQQHYDVLVTATVPIPPFEAGREVPKDWPGERWWTWSTLTFPFNITGQPALSAPCGFTSGGLPIGVQFVGGRHREDLVLKAAHAYQRANPLMHLRPDGAS